MRVYSCWISIFSWTLLWDSWWRGNRRFCNNWTSRMKIKVWLSIFLNDDIYYVDDIDGVLYEIHWGW